MLQTLRKTRKKIKENASVYTNANEVLLPVVPVVLVDQEVLEGPEI